MQVLILFGTLILVLARLSAREKLYLTAVYLNRSGFAVVKSYKEITRYHVNIGYNACTIGSFYRRANAWGYGGKIFIGILLVFKTAHKSAAASRNIGRIDRKPLLLCHFNGNRLEIIKKTLTAEGLTAKTKSAEHSCLIANAYLTKLDAGMEM